jgi:transcription elongation factor Elf1
MSKFIGKRVFYHCSHCNSAFTLSRKTVDKSQEMNLVFCSKKCWNDWQKHSDAVANAKLDVYQEVIEHIELTLPDYKHE